jgi:hypothetical protein
VLLDRELAALYGVSTARLNQQVRRNTRRFPADFLFELTAEELANLKLHFATSSWGGRRTLPLAFTEHGAIMAATVLNSAHAVDMAVYVTELAQRVDSHDSAIRNLVETIRRLVDGPPATKRPIGFVPIK